METTSENTHTHTHTKPYLCMHSQLQHLLVRVDDLWWCCGGLVIRNGKNGSVELGDSEVLV